MSGTGETSAPGKPGGIPETLAHLAVPLDDLKPYGANPRRGNVTVIAESLAVNGQYRPVVANRRTGEVLAGNHTLQAARHLGWEQLAATWVDVDDEAAARIVLVDNRANDLAGYDDTVLLALLQDLPDLSGTGYDAAALAALLAEATEIPEVLTDPDDVPIAPKHAVSVDGDVWLLGPHRLAVGDSTSIDVVERALGGRRANLLWTDPPYGVSYVGKTADALVIENDTLDASDLEDLLRGAFGCALACTEPGAAWYVASPPGPLLGVFGQVLSELDVWRQTLVWVKDAFVLGHSDYHNRFEPIFYGWSPGAAHHPIPDRSQDTVWEIARPKRSAEHPTMKPVALMARAIENSTNLGGLVLDMFGGSGSTLIAAHGTRRVAALVELDPKYADVICRRYQEHTGTIPVHEATGRSHDFTAADAAL